MVKKLFKDDRVLSRLSAQLGSLRQQLNLVKWSGLFPPALRDKDRFLRTFIIAKWADRMDSHWGKLASELSLSSLPCSSIFPCIPRPRRIMKRRARPQDAENGRRPPRGGARNNALAYKAPNFFLWGLYPEQRCMFFLAWRECCKNTRTEPGVGW
jgi:hypothetical protein